MPAARPRLARAMAAPAQAPAAARAAITVHACDQQGKKQTFKVNSTTKMQALFDAYAKSEDVDSRCFLFKGSRVHAEQTAADLGLVEGDQLDVELVTGEEAEAAGDDPDLLGNFYLDRLRGEAATRPIWALSRGLAGVVDEALGNYEKACSMARPLAALAATCKRARDLCTPGLRACLVHLMAHALARGGAFLKGKRAGTLVASLIKHTTHSPPERLGLVPLLICDETVEVLLPLLRCADWIDLADDGILEVFTNYPSFLYDDDKLDGRLQVRDVAALLLCVRSLRLPDDFMSKFDDDNCWDFSAGY